jgi:hypothetical protein
MKFKAKFDFIYIDIIIKAFFYHKSFNTVNGKGLHCHILHSLSKGRWL